MGNYDNGIQMKTMLSKSEIEAHSGYRPNLDGLVKPIREGYYILDDITITGAAPKDFVKIYEYGEARKSSPSQWPGYIAKVGHKWYPNESITEHLITCIGKIIDANVADTRLMLAKGQLRLLSKYFLNPDRERLVHGSEIFSAHFDDEAFVQEVVEEVEKTRALFTYQCINEAIMDVYRSKADVLMKDFTYMLFFDAIVGNNDRHFENWGVIESIFDDADAKFAPIYDTARGLFWNRPESSLDGIIDNEASLNSYIDNSMPTTGWDQREDLNHFQLLELVIDTFPEYCGQIITFDFESKLESVKTLINSDFKDFFSKKRRYLIAECLTRRFERVQRLISQ